MEYTMRLAEQAAQAFGYKEQKTFHEKTRFWYPLISPKVLKHQFQPVIIWQPSTVEITAPNWRVKFYLGREPLTGSLTYDGVSIQGDPAGGLDKVFAAWENPQIERMYQTKLTWLKANPGYWLKPEKKEPVKKKIYASQIEA